MADVIRIVVPGEPVAKGAAKSALVRRGASVFTHKYTPEKTTRGMRDVRVFGAEAMAGRPLLDGPIVLTIRSYRASGLKGMSKHDRAEALAGRIRPTTKPDTDNYTKLTKDGLTGVVWTDDARVVEDHVGKWYSDQPRVEIEVTPWTP
jgi:Holliday junction resolvase RusA-like endonuclease